MKHSFISILPLSTLLVFLLISQSPAQQPVFKETKVIENAENIIAVDNVCAWPNLRMAI